MRSPRDPFCTRVSLHRPRHSSVFRRRRRASISRTACGLACAVAVWSHFALADAGKVEVSVEIRGRRVVLRQPVDGGGSELARAVREHLIDELLGQSEVSLPAPVQTECMRLLTSRLNDAAVSALQEYGRRLAAALRAVHVRHEDPDKVYETMLRGFMRRETWRGWLERYDSADSVAAVEQRFRQSAESVRERLRKQWRRDLRLYCLAEAVLDLVHAPRDAATVRATLDRVWRTYCRAARIRVPGERAFSLQELGSFPHPALTPQVRRLLDKALADGRIRVGISPALRKALEDEPGYAAGPQPVDDKN